MSENNKKLNLLVLGQYASGKSALINSFVGNNINASDNPIEVKVDDRDVVIFESNTNFKSFLEIADKNSFVITYCVSSNSMGIPEEDISMINECIENKYSVIIALTKSDLSVKEQLTELVKNIKEKTKCYRIVTIANVESYNYFGVKEYKNAVFRTFKRNNSEDDYIELNMLILGQTGVGKSSLINALVGYKVEETRIGKPCTPEGIFPHKTSIDGKDVVIYDSWGLESGKSEKWEKILKNELEKRGADKDIKDWFHSVTYCIQAGKAKIQDFDIKIIKQFLENKYNVIVAMTKADQIEESRRKEFIDIIKKETGVETVIAVGAAPERKRGMKETPEPLGLEDYKATTLISWRKIFIDRIPLYIIEKIKIDINKKRDELKNKDFKEEDLNVLSENISKEFQDFIELQINTYYKETIIQYYQISKEMININPNLNISNDKKISGYQSFIEYFYSESGLVDCFDDWLYPQNLATILIASPIIILGTVFASIGDIFGLIHFNTYGKKDAINNFIDEKAKNSINEISKPEFENKLRDGINEILVKIEEELKNRLENNIKE